MNFVYYNVKALWASNSANPNNTPPYHLRMQDDGNLVLYDRTEKVIFTLHLSYLINNY